MERADRHWLSLITRIRDGQDQAAFAELFRHFAPRVKGFLIKAGLEDASAEECTQEVMATVWHKAAQFDPTRASLATWIFTIARNRRIDLARRSARVEPEDLPWGPQAEPDQAEALEMQQDCRRLSDAVKKLPQAQAELIRKAYFSEMSHGEIAKLTGLPLGTIKSRLRLALKRLRQEMNDP